MSDTKKGYGWLIETLLNEYCVFFGGESQVSQIWRHKRRGSVYTLVGVATAQSDKPIEEGEEVQVYRDEKGNLQIRRYSEFHDGRFEKIVTVNPDDAESGMKI